jgi:hypothetical protein
MFPSSAAVEVCTHGPVLVTGGTGFVAGHIVSQLLSKGYRVRASVRDLENRKSYEHLTTLEHADENLEIVEADLIDADSWAKAFEGQCGVLQLAIELRNESLLVNIVVMCRRSRVCVPRCCSLCPQASRPRGRPDGTHGHGHEDHIRILPADGKRQETDLHKLHSNSVQRVRRFT